MADTLITDTECFANYWSIGFRRVSDGAIMTMEKSARTALDRARLERLVRNHRIVTFNGLGYDWPMIWAAIGGASNAELLELSNQIIQGSVPWWSVEELYLVQKYAPVDRNGRSRLPRLDHIDLIEPQPNAIASLKTLNGRMHGRRMQDLPYEPGAVLTFAEMDRTTVYMRNDLAATTLLFRTLGDAIKLREALGAEYDLDFRSKSDSQIGEAIVKRRVEEARRRAGQGDRVQRAEVRPGSMFRYTPPAFLKFERADLCSVLARLRDTQFVVQSNGKVDLPKWLGETRVQIGLSTYAMGIGGLHSTEEHRSIYSDDGNVLIDFDVASYYPAIILGSGLYPKALGADFLTVYRKIRDERIAAKRAGDKTKAEGLKIALNGVYGKLGSRFSILYAPHLMIAVTLTGQLSLLMLIERAEAAGIPVISGNTDGIVFRCPRDREDDLTAITKQWEADTGFELEATRYRSLHSASVNTYYAIKEDGKAKRKGLVSNPWAESPPDIRGLLMKNPNMTICSDAALAYIMHGTPVAETIRACRDVRAFVTVVNVRGGATWRDEYLGKVVRYIWSTDCDPILYKIPHAKTGNFKKVPKTDQARPLMELPDAFPDDLDYERYIAEANDILREVGAAYRPPVLPKMAKARGEVTTIRALWLALVDI